MTSNKYHWYDGWFYDSVIAPNQDKLFAQIKNLIKPDSTVIDIGCGTGRLEFALADICNSLVGIDLSDRNIARANKVLTGKPNDKITFRHSNISDIISEGNIHFDYAVLTYVIHEVNEEHRIKLLTDIAGVSDLIIIGDYITPLPKGFESFITESIEFIAGREHYRNFRNYQGNGGIHYLANKTGLSIVNEITIPGQTNHIVVLSK